MNIKILVKSIVIVLGGLSLIPLFFYACFKIPFVLVGLFATFCIGGMVSEVYGELRFAALERESEAEKKRKKVEK